MRVLVPRLLLALLLVLLGTTVLVSLNLEDEASPVALLRQSQPLLALRPNTAKKTVAFVGRLASIPLSGKDSTFHSHSGASLIALVYVLRC